VSGPEACQIDHDGNVVYFVVGFYPDMPPPPVRPTGWVTAIS
jgi:hypothetical protein